MKLTIHLTFIGVMVLFLLFAIVNFLPEDWWPNSVAPSNASSRVPWGETLTFQTCNEFTEPRCVSTVSSTTPPVPVDKWEEHRERARDAKRKKAEEDAIKREYEEFCGVGNVAVPYVTGHYGVPETSDPGTYNGPAVFSTEVVRGCIDYSLVDDSKL